ncbi:hypothetical protein V5O48_004228 [Marasmius crinis-equi]|uniref:Uncharacterized protein n=1 Tax=Marasmius crinis-equi TaxID=585013 RepID=A0ABR3FQR1_9AGAR
MLSNHRFAFLSFILLLLPIAYGQSEDASLSCEAAARRLGQPVDGWRIVKTFEKSPSGKKRVKSEACVREVTDLECKPLETLYYHPETREARCCQQDGSVTWYDEEAKLGFCCATGHHWSGDISTGEGGCCPLETVMVEGRCVDKPPTSSCGCHSKTANIDENEDEAITKTSTVAKSMVSTPLGIAYGSCYSLSLADGTPIGANRENSIYSPNGLFNGIPFRVCRSTDDCDSREINEDNVSSTDTFYLKDTMGRFNDPEGKMGWVADTRRGKLHLMFTWDSNEAEEYDAEKGEACGETDCLKLSGVPLELVFVGTDCWDESAEPNFIEQS